MIVCLVEPDVLADRKIHRYLLACLEEVGFDTKEVEVVSVLEEIFYGKAPAAMILEYAKRAVRPWIMDNLADIELIIPFGNLSLCSSGLTKQPTGINSHRGRQYKVAEFGDIPLVPTQSVRATFVSPQAREPFMVDLKFAQCVHSNTVVGEEAMNKIMLTDPDMIMDLMLPEVQDTGTCGYDYETSGLDAWQCLAVTGTYVSGKQTKDKAYNVYIYEGHRELEPLFTPKQYRKFQKYFTNFYKDAGQGYDLIGWNIGFDDWVAETHCGCELPGSQWDAQIMKWCYNSEKPNNLKDATTRYLGFPNYDGFIDDSLKVLVARRGKVMSIENNHADYECLRRFDPKAFEELVVKQNVKGVNKGLSTFKWPKGIDKKLCGYAMLNGDVLTHYNALDSVYTYKLWEFFYPLLERDGLQNSYALRHAINRELWKAEQRGMVLDQAQNREFSEKLEDITEKSLFKIRKLVKPYGEELAKEFNPDSRDHVSQLLYGEVGYIPRVKRANLYRDFDEKDVDSICDEVEKSNYGEIDEVKDMLRDGSFDQEAAEDNMQNLYYKLTGDPKMLYFVPTPVGLGGLGYDPPAMTKTGLTSCSKSSLLTLRSQKDSDLLSLILMYRKSKKIKKTFVDNVFKSLRPGGVVSASYNVTGTETARISSSSRLTVNKFQWQNFEKHIRGQFIPRKGYKFVTLDYSAAEVRVLAAFSQDPSLMYSVNSGEDLHYAMASQVFKKAISEVTKEERSRSKNATFLTLYGGGADKLAASFGITKSEAQEIIDKLFGAFPEAKVWMDAVIKEAVETLQVRTAVGSRRWLKNIISEDNRERMKAERQAVNSIIQGSAGELTLAKILEILKKGKKAFGEDSIYLAATVHDSMTFEVKEELAWFETDADGNETYHGDMVDLILKVCDIPSKFYPMNTLRFPVDLQVEDYWDGKPDLLITLNGKTESEFRADLLEDIPDEDKEDEELILKI